MTTMYRRIRTRAEKQADKPASGLRIWWAWTARPFLLNPIATIKDLLRVPDPITEHDLAQLTPEERKALK